MRTRTRTLRRTVAAGSLLTLSLSLAACGGGDDEATPASSESDTSMAHESPSDAMSEDMSDDMSEHEMTDEMTDDMTEHDMTEHDMSGSPAAHPESQTFGPGCKLVPADGDGSFDGMAETPVAAAASANPLLSTLVIAVKKAGLVDTLNSAPELTVFAPTNDAFAKIPEKDLDALLANKKELTTVLTHHVVEGRLSPEDVAGKHQTLAGDTITVKGSGEEFKVAEGGSMVICGNVPTANATVYIVDTVLMPAM